LVYSLGLLGLRLRGPVYKPGNFEFPSIPFKALELSRSPRHNSRSQEIPQQGTPSVAKQSRKKAVKEQASAIHIHEEALPVASESPSNEPSTLNKSEEIRKLATEIQGRGEKPRPVTIVNTLKARGITVSSPQVSMVLKKVGVERRPRKAKTSAAPTAKASSVSGGESFTVHQLLAAKKFVEMIGSARQAMAVLDALDKIS
jgi:arginine repressor